VGRSRSAVVQLDLKNSGDKRQALDLLAEADALIEGFRPGVMERLGLGPDVVLGKNPRLAYGRMTGWGQDGPLALEAGHDINYVSLSGALAAMGREGEPPAPPLNLVGDYGGGALYLVVGLLAAILSARTTGKGQVVDTAMCDGAASLMTQFFALQAQGSWTTRREGNLLDGGAPFYRTYLCADGKAVAVGPIESQFYSILREKLSLGDPLFERQNDKSAWPEMRVQLAEIFSKKTRDEWVALFDGSDGCLTPVLDLDEAPTHPHLKARHTFVNEMGGVQPAPAPRFSLTRSRIRNSPALPPIDAQSVLQRWRLPAISHHEEH
jgi:alpha-methylacyl-CoA racemase